MPSTRHRNTLRACRSKVSSTLAGPATGRSRVSMSINRNGTTPLRCASYGTPAIHTRRRHPNVAGMNDRRRSRVVSPAQALELAPQALARPALPSDERDRWSRLPHDGWAVVHVAGRGDGGPDTRLDRSRDLDDALAIADERLHPITDSDLRRGLCRRSIDEDVATVAQPGRERPGLHEAHRAQPAIDTRLVSGDGSSHAS
jgi:hypothetical protein